MLTWLIPSYSPGWSPMLTISFHWQGIRHHCRESSSMFLLVQSFHASFVVGLPHSNSWRSIWIMPYYLVPSIITKSIAPFLQRSEDINSSPSLEVTCLRALFLPQHLSHLSLHLSAGTQLGHWYSWGSKTKISNRESISNMWMRGRELY